MPLPLLLPIGMSVASLLGGMFSNRKKTTTRNQSSTSTATNSTMPVENPMGAGVLENIRAMIQARMSAPMGLPQGYQEGGIREINNVFDVVNQSKNANLTARGLGGSPIAGAVMDSSENARGGEVARFVSGLPLVARQLQNEDLGMAQQFYSSLPRGATSTQTRTGTDTGTQTDPGNMLGGGMNSLAAMLAFLYGNDAFAGGGGGGRPLNNRLSPVAPTLPGWTIPRGTLG